MGILLIGAAACCTALILSAWLMTFARWFPIDGIDGKFLIDYKTMIRAHVDYALMALFGFTVNTLTMLALVLAIGLVVDDAIVVLENIFRHIENGMAPFHAAIRGVS